MFFLPDYLGHADNYIEANPLVTPPHIVPEWYFLPFYAILRAIPSKLGGVIAMFSAIVVLVFVPWLDTSRVRSAKYRPLYKWFFWLLVIRQRRRWATSAPSRRRRLRDLVAHLHGLLLRALPARDADPRHHRDADRAAEIHIGLGAAAAAGRRAEWRDCGSRDALSGGHHSMTDERF